MVWSGHGGSVPVNPVMPHRMRARQHVGPRSLLGFLKKQAAEPPCVAVMLPAGN